MYRDGDPELVDLAAAIVRRLHATERAHIGISTPTLNVLGYFDRFGLGHVEITEKETETECP